MRARIAALIDFGDKINYAAGKCIFTLSKPCPLPEHRHLMSPWESPAMKKLRAVLIVLLVLLSASAASAEGLPIVDGVELQPLAAQAKRIQQALRLLGAPLTKEQRAELKAAANATDPRAGARQIQAVLDPLCLVGVSINPESRVKAAVGPAPKQLIQQGWRVFLIKVHNEAGVTSELNCKSPNAELLYKPATNHPEPKQTVSKADELARWMDLAMYGGQPLNKALSGLPLEYRIVQVYSRDAGAREATLSFNVGQGTQDLGFRSDVHILFDCRPAVEVKLQVFDDDGQPTVGQFTIRDAQGHIYPSMVRRQPPDFFFQEQIYRRDGETILLPPGVYKVNYSRGPEYDIQGREIIVPDAKSHLESFRLKRWINLASHGWYSGDHHVHAAGCAHFDSPTEGVKPTDMIRHIEGEDLNVGCVLSWGPCWYFQKQFFEGKTSHLSTPKHLMRYDVEVSGFPSSYAGHLCLLRLKDDDYPGTTRIDEWPSWCLPVMQWAKKQDAVVGFAHSGSGLTVGGTSLPSYEMPRFDGIGANEYIVDVTHGVCDFISAVDTPITWELSIWYHTLNCGYTCRISGETDFPCITGERVGRGRAYVKLLPGETLDYDRWVEAIRDGRSYCCDGLSHLFDFSVNGLGVGEAGAEGRASTLAIKAGEPLSIKVQAAAMLPEKPRNEIRSKRLEESPNWHVERARIGDSRKVPVELIVNGQAVDRREIEADGAINDLTFDYKPTQSCWVALRIFASAHTNPVFVEIDGKPIRASKKSAQWCLDAVDVCWNAKLPGLRSQEREAAEAAYESARAAYRKILAECAAD